MYVNGSLAYPSVVPMEFVLNYWTSYSAYHEAAYAALMNSNKSALIRDNSHLTRCERDGEGSIRDVRTSPPNSDRHGSKRAYSPCHKPGQHTTKNCSRLSNDDQSGKTSRSASSSNQLKFGISRILSDKVGVKDSSLTDKSERKSISVDNPVPPSCPCSSSSSCPYAICRQIPSLSSSLSAVHALRPPQYPVTSGTDSLPGPYSILNTEPGCSSQPKRKRSWSRAVFSQLQRKGLEKRFEVQKYVTKPDRRQLAAMLGLTDAQVKVWFQNRRMKWRHAEKSAGESTSQSTQGKGDEESNTGQKENIPANPSHDLTVTSSELREGGEIADSPDVECSDQEEEDKMECDEQAVSISDKNTTERPIS